MDCSGMNQFDGNGKPSKKGGRKGNGKKGKGRTSLMRLSHSRLFRFRKGRKSAGHGMHVTSDTGNRNKGGVKSPSPRDEEKHGKWRPWCSHDHTICRLLSNKPKPFKYYTYEDEYYFKKEQVAVDPPVPTEFVDKHWAYLLERLRDSDESVDLYD